MQNIEEGINDAVNGVAETTKDAVDNMGDTIDSMDGKKDK